MPEDDKKKIAAIVKDLAPSVRDVESAIRVVKADPPEPKEALKKDFENVRDNPFAPIPNKTVRDQLAAGYAIDKLIGLNPDVILSHGLKADKKTVDAISAALYAQIDTDIKKHPEPTVKDEKTVERLTSDWLTVLKEYNKAHLNEGDPNSIPVVPGSAEKMTGKANP